MKIGATTPHDETALWLKNGEEKRQSVQQMFGEIAPSYDRLNRWMSLNLDRRWRAKALDLADIGPRDTVLDLCCGTGDFLVLLKDRTPRALGIDFSLPMLGVAQEKLGGNRLSLGDACQVPVRSGTVDAVTVGWGIRNVPDIDLAHQEIFRVLKSGGRFVSIDMARPANPILRRISSWVATRFLPRFAALMSSQQAYAYLGESTQRFRTREELIESMVAAGFVRVITHDLFMGNICIHRGEKP